MINLLLTLFTMIFTSNILVCQVHNYKSILGDWNVVDDNHEVMGKIKIQEVTDSIEVYKEDESGNFIKQTTFSNIPVKVYKEDEFGNFIGQTTFSNIPVKSGFGLEYENKLNKVNGSDTTRNHETILFTISKENSVDCLYLKYVNIPVNHNDRSGYYSYHWGGTLEKIFHSVEKEKDIRIRVFKMNGKGKKIEIPKKELEDSNGVMICQVGIEEYIDRIEVDGHIDGSLYIVVTGYGGKIYLQNDEVDYNQYFHWRKRKHVYPIFPWIKGGLDNSYTVEFYIKDFNGKIVKKFYEFTFFFFNCYP